MWAASSIEAERAKEIDEVGRLTRRPSTICRVRKGSTHCKIHVDVLEIEENRK